MRDTERMRRRTVRPLPPPLLARKHTREAEIAFSTYILQGKKVVRCLDRQLWEDWIDYPDERCIIGRTDFLCDLTIVETRFIGIDVAMVPSLGPLVFETTVDGGEMHGYRALWKTWQAAKDGHEEACHLVRETFN
jgi:hypothetical protein